MIYLNSSAIRAVDYDPFTGHLEIQFTSSGRWYSFYRVPSEVAAGLVDSTSPGTYYHDHIQGRYR